MTRPLRCAAAVLAVGLLLAGCSSDDGDLPPAFEGSGPESPSSEPSSSADPSASAASNEPVNVVLEKKGSSAKAGDVVPAFKGFFSDLAKAMADPEKPPKSEFALPSAQILIDQRAERLREADRTLTGPITLTVTINVSGKAASVSGCLDQSKVQATRGGDPVKLDDSARLPVRAQLTGSGKSWLVQSFSVPTTSSC